MSYPHTKEYKEVKAILDNLIWNGEHIPYISTQSRFCIYFRQVKALTSIIPNYETITTFENSKQSLGGYIEIYFNDFGFMLNLQCPCACKDNAVSKFREFRWYEHINKLPSTPWGVDNLPNTSEINSCPFKTESKSYMTSKKIGETVLRWLDMSYKLIKDGYEWSISDGVQKDIQQYIEHKKIVSKIEAEMSKIQKKINLENEKFGVYHRKYMDNFRKLKNIYKDF